MYLVAIAWIYVVLMMAVAEAFSTQGSLLGALITFVLYGVLPLGLVLYILNTPHRKARLQAATQPVPEGTSTVQPDASGHAATAAQSPAVPTVGKEP